MFIHVIIFDSLIMKAISIHNTNLKLNVQHVNIYFDSHNIKAFSNHNTR